MNCVKSVKPKSDEKRTDKNVGPTKTEINPESRATTIAAVSEQPKPVVTPKADDVPKVDDGKKKSVSPKISESEFVSDEFQTSNETDLAEVKDGMRKLGIDSMTQQAALPSNDGKRGIVSKFNLWFD